MTEPEAPLSASHNPLRFATIDIYKCLAPCKECTGNYISETLQKRFICYCRCHYIITGNDIDSTTSNLTEEGISV